MTALSDRQREEDAAFFEDWSRWRLICDPQIAHRRFLIGPILHNYEQFLLRIPGSTKVSSNYWKMSFRLNYRGVYVPALEWRRLISVLAAISVDEDARRARSPKSNIATQSTHDEGRHRRHAHASGGSKPSDFREAEKTLRRVVAPATPAQRAYLAVLLKRAGRGGEALPSMSTHQASAMIQSLKATL